MLHLLPAIDAVLYAEHRRVFFNHRMKQRDNFRVVVGLHRVDHQVHGPNLRGLVSRLYLGCELSLLTPHLEAGTLDGLQVPSASD